MIIPRVSKFSKLLLELALASLLLDGAISHALPRSGALLDRLDREQFPDHGQILEVVLSSSSNRGLATPNLTDKVPWCRLPHGEGLATLYRHQTLLGHESIPDVRHIIELSPPEHEKGRWVWVSQESVSRDLRNEAGTSASALSESFLRDAFELSSRSLAQVDASAPVYVDISTSSLQWEKDVRFFGAFEEKSALLWVSSQALPWIDVLLPRFVRPTALLSNTVGHTIQELTAPDKERNFNIPSPSLDPHIFSFLHSKHWSTSSLNATVRILTGEDETTLAARDRWHSRHSATWGAWQASKWILGELLEAFNGAGVEGVRCELEEHTEGFSPNVACIVAGSEDDENIYSAQTTRAAKREAGAVLLSAHYDSRGTFGNPAAPGGDDDGSGTTMLIAVARTLADAVAADQRQRKSQGSPASATKRNLTPRREIQIVFFSGEEQGLIGSKSYAEHLAARRTPGSSGLPRSYDLRLALQTDMIAYRAPGEPLQIAFPDKLSTSSATDYLMAVARLYVPELVPGYTPACCSDHQSFWEQGFPATWVFERNGPIADPRYHNSGDLSARDGYDFDQLAATGKVVFAGAAGLIWE